MRDFELRIGLKGIDECVRIENRKLIMGLRDSRKSMGIESRIWGRDTL